MSRAVSGEGWELGGLGVGGGGAVKGETLGARLVWKNRSVLQFK